MGRIPKTVAIVEARVGPPGLKARAVRKLSGHSLLELVVRRVTDCLHLDAVVVVSSSRHIEGAIRAAVPPDVPLFSDGPDDLLGRYLAAADHFAADAVVRVCSDNLFVDPVFIDRLITTAREHPDSDYVSYQSRNGQPVILSPLGVLAEWCRVEALRAADRQASSAEDRENVTRWVYSHPEQFRLRLIPLPAQLDRDGLRFSINDEEDWEYVQTMFDTLGPDLDWHRIAGLLGQQSELRERMERMARDHAKV